MREVVITGAVRTAMGKFNGSLTPFSAPELGSLVIKAVLARTNVAANAVDEVIMGNVLQAGLGQNPARQAAMKAMIPAEVPSFTVNKVCGSGMKAVVLASQAIALGEADTIIAGGCESMTNAPYILQSSARWGYRMGDGKVIDGMVHDGLWCAFADCHMGVTAENVAVNFNISREEQDQAALASQHKAQRAIENGVFKEEIVPVVITGKKGDVVFDTDEFPRFNVTLEQLAALKPAFKKGGTVTAGNASGINDGAAALMVMSAEKARQLNLAPLGRIVSYAAVGVEPSIMGIAAAGAARKALVKAGLRLEDVDLFESNEAFGATYVAVGKELGWPAEKVNVHGGAIALGHPIGASGARILTTLLYALKQHGGRYGLATMCIGGGQGIAMVVERL